MVPTMHLLVSQYGDPIFFVRHEATNTVHISGAERSFGNHWVAGTFSVQDARDLWDRIISGGGRVADQSIAAKITSVVEEANADMRQALLNANHDLKEFQTRLAAVNDKVEEAERRHEEAYIHWMKEIDLRVTEAIQALMGNPTLVENFNDREWVKD